MIVSLWSIEPEPGIVLTAVRVTEPGHDPADRWEVACSHCDDDAPEAFSVLDSEAEARDVVWEHVQRHDLGVTTTTGKVLHNADIEALADEAERGYDVEHLRDQEGR